jgi:hypothetical protein
MQELLHLFLPEIVRSLIAFKAELALELTDRLPDGWVHHRKVPDGKLLRWRRCILTLMKHVVKTLVLASV